MVAVGSLVKEHCSVDSKQRMGTVVKVSPLILSTMGLNQAKEDIERAKERYTGLNREYDPMNNQLIRPGKVFSVRWQDDPTKLTIHVVYDDCNGQAMINLGSNMVQVVK